MSPFDQKAYRAQFFRIDDLKIRKGKKVDTKKKKSIYIIDQENQKSVRISRRNPTSLLPIVGFEL